MKRTNSGVNSVLYRVLMIGSIYSVVLIYVCYKNLLELVMGYEGLDLRCLLSDSIIRLRIRVDHTVCSCEVT